MATLRKPTYNKPLPPDAKLTTKDGKQFARIQHKGRPITAPVTKDGRKVRIETDEWYVRYKDAAGAWKWEKGYTDKQLTDDLRVKIEARVAREKVALTDPIKAHLLRPLPEHIEAFESHLAAKDNSEQHVREVVAKVNRIVKGCKWATVADLAAGPVECYLMDLRQRKEKGISAQTSNHYLRAIKQFSRWLVRDRRMKDDPLAYMSLLNVSTDRRHDRRAVSEEEFRLLIEAAEVGPRVEGVHGPDRAMLYILAAWTGYRRKELASLSLHSFDFVGQPPSVQVLAGYSKNKRTDSVPLHPVLVDRLTAWLADKHDLDPDASLFALQTDGGWWRKTSKMMSSDLGRARKQWIKNAKTPEERAERKASDFLEYQDHDGLFADFHANRHTFISNLSKAQVPLAMGQKLARHHDPKLTANTYTHLELHDKAAAIESLPAPPKVEPPKDGADDSAEAVEQVHPEVAAEPLRATGTDGHQAGTLSQPCHGSPPEMAQIGTMGHKPENEGSAEESTQPVKGEGVGTALHNPAQVHPRGLEPLTFGSVGHRLQAAFSKTPSLEAEDWLDVTPMKRKHVRSPYFPDFAGIRSFATSSRTILGQGRLVPHPLPSALE